MTNAVNKSKVTEKYKRQLPENLQSVYEKITKERTRIYYQGYILGFIVSLLLIMLTKKKMSTLSMVCLVGATSFVVNYFYYILSKKSDYMLNHIDTHEQNVAWLKMYRGMQVYYHTGLALGIVAICFIALAFREKK